MSLLNDDGWCKRYVGLLEPSDLPYEEDVAQNGGEAEAWFRYVVHLKKRQQQEERASKGRGEAVRDPLLRFLVYERAVAALPREAALWESYVAEREEYCRAHFTVPHPAFGAANRLHERALAECLQRDPGAWLGYARFLAAQGLLTLVRYTFNRALRCLEQRHHPTIWRAFLQFALQHQDRLPELAAHAYKRLLPAQPLLLGECLDYLQKREMRGEALLMLQQVLLQDIEQDGKGEREHAVRWGMSPTLLWDRVCELLAGHSGPLPQGLDGERLLESGRRGLAERRAPGEGRFWVAQTALKCRRGDYRGAQELLSTALRDATFLSDFAQVWEAAVKLQDTLLSMLLEYGDISLTTANSSAPPPNSYPPSITAAMLKPLLQAEKERYEMLLGKRQIWVQRIVLRSEPHRTDAWLKIARHQLLLTSSATKPLAVLERALRAVDPFLAQPPGSHWQLWACMARVHEDTGNPDAAIAIFERVLLPQFPSQSSSSSEIPPISSPQELAALWCAFVEMLLRLRHFPQALEQTRAALSLPMAVFHAAGLQAPAQLAGVAKSLGPRNHSARLCKSSRLWGLLLDLEESFGTPDTLRRAFSAAVAYRAVTPEMLLNYARCLQEGGRPEEALRVYEQGASLFPHPFSDEIWLSHLSFRLSSSDPSQTPHTRDLFEQALESCPSGSDLALPLSLLFAQFEHRHGAPRSVLGIYDRAIDAVKPSQRLLLIRVYIAHASRLFGVSRVREVFERSIEAVAPAEVPLLCVPYAAMEESLGQVHRARAIFKHCSQFCNPQTRPEFWSTWQEFEERHQTPDTTTPMFEFLRIKKVVALSFSKAFIGNLQSSHTPNQPQEDARRPTNKNPAPSCPNVSNPFHECTPYCHEHFK